VGKLYGHFKGSLPKEWGSHQGAFEVVVRTLSHVFFLDPSPVRRVPIPNRYTAKAKLCFCKNNKRSIIISIDTVKPHVVKVLHKNVAYDRTRAPLFSLSGRARERARVLRLARRPSVGSSPCMRLARSPCISTLGDAASTPSTAARSWTDLTRAQKPVRSTSCVSIRHPSARPCTHLRQAPQHAGPR